ncbi:ATP-binding protein [Dyella amyloliquefaciens]|uniref:ATP-binding protein n=1 Tax=Dyella amyloliquefaciens TaxID=1770545 RepID=UPI00102E4FF8|nr:winged helix-turn-helix domain-containing protein [Dyella amyloliquefaciens]
MGSSKHPTNQGKSPAYAFADVVVEACAHRLTRGGREIAVEPKAFSVLLELLAHPGELLSRDDLLDAVWGHNYVTPSTLSRVIAQLRRAMADDSEQPRYIQTVHGLGYRFIAPIEGQAPQPAPALSFAPPVRARLPERTGSLIGRAGDLQQLGQLLRDTRLVTIAGAGGIGKTQAALELARTHAEDFPDGVWLLDCTSQTDGEGLARWLAGLFDIRVTTSVDELLGRVGELLRTRRVLLVFDNCERIAGAVGIAVEALLAASVDPRVLVTSQHRLNCVGETLYWLPPLAVPPPGEWATSEDAERLSHVPAVQLLLARSRAFASRFALTPANAPAVADICRRLDGLPLALEIAAARLRLLSPEQLLERMDVHLLNLAEASPSRPARHQTLHALIEWSFALLSEHERSLLTGLAVFVGTCTLGGANAVGEVFGLDDEQVMDALGGLVDKSLLVVDPATRPPSYHLLDSVRLFALEKLREGSHEADVRGAHLAHFVRLCRRVDAGIRGEHEQLLTERVRRDWANLHLASDYALSLPDHAEQALALSGNLCWYFRISTNYGESANWLDQALRAGGTPTRERAQALIACGTMQHQSQQHDRAQTLLREGIALARQLNDPRLAAAGQAVMAFEYATFGDISGAMASADDALAIANEQDDAWLRSMALLGRGVALALDEQHREAEGCLSDAFDAVSTPVHGKYQLVYVLINRALQRYYLSRFSGAAHDWLACIDGFSALEHWRGVAGCVEGAAYLLSEREDAPQAARFLGAAARVRVLTAAPLMPQWRKAQSETERWVRDTLGASFEPAQREGAATRFERIVVEARRVLEAVASDQLLRTGVSSPSGS